MFSGIHDLGKSEQAEAFRKVNQMLGPNGIFVVDVPNRESNPRLLGSYVDTRFPGIPVLYQTYSPSEADFLEFAEKSGFILSEKRYYDIVNHERVEIDGHKFPRISYIFKKMLPITE